VGKMNKKSFTIPRRWARRESWRTKGEGGMAGCWLQVGGKGVGESTGVMGGMQCPKVGMWVQGPHEGTFDKKKTWSYCVSTKVKRDKKKSKFFKG